MLTHWSRSWCGAFAWPLGALAPFKLFDSGLKVGNVSIDSTVSVYVQFLTQEGVIQLIRFPLLQLASVVALHPKFGSLAAWATY